MQMQSEVASRNATVSITTTAVIIFWFNKWKTNFFPRCVQIFFLGSTLRPSASEMSQLRVHNCHFEVRSSSSINRIRNASNFGFGEYFLCGLRNPISVILMTYAISTLEGKNKSISKIVNRHKLTFTAVTH